MISTNPQVSAVITKHLVHDIEHQRRRVIGDVSVNGELISVKTVQSVLSANPYIARLILTDTRNIRIRQFVTCKKQSCLRPHTYAVAPDNEQ